MNDKQRRWLLIGVFVALVSAQLLTLVLGDISVGTIVTAAIVVALVGVSVLIVAKSLKKMGL